MENVYSIFNISHSVQNTVIECERKAEDIYKKIDEVALYNQAKVLKAFQQNKVSSMHFAKSTGYGYNDVGREVIEKIYAEVFKCEDSLVRIQFVNGTHAISTALYATLMPGDKLLSITGLPYDTLHQVIGIEDNVHSLKNYSVKYSQIDLTENGDFDYINIEEFLKANKVKVISIQRSKGYAFRKTLCIDDIEKAVKLIRQVDPNVIILVDNCYGEFVETKEPTEVGADLVCGSLIKNIGGGLCETGGYIAGKKEYIELCAQKLTTPGIGKECGATLGQNKNILNGLFVAPTTVKNALKSAVFAAAIFGDLGYETMPKFDDKRSDSIQSIKFNDEEKLIKFIQAIQYASPVDSHVTPYPWDMPGYSDKVIMAAGTFVEGASIELSADSPIRPPYVAYIQGGLTYESAKLALMIAAQRILGDK